MEDIKINYAMSYARQRYIKIMAMYYSLTGYSTKKSNLAKRKLRKIQKRINKTLS